MRKIPFTTLLTKELFYGAAAAAVVGLGAGAYLKPPAEAKPKDDPYAGVTINLPADPTVAQAGLSSASWMASQAPAVPVTPAAWQSAETSSAYRAQAQPARPTPAVLTRREGEDAAEPRQIADDRGDRRPNWPSVRGDVVDQDDGPAFAEPPPYWRRAPYEPPPPRYWRREPPPDYGPPDGPPSRDDDD